MITLKNLLDKTKTGEFRLPSFQRDFVWSARQTSRLIHSLCNGKGHIGLITGCIQTPKVKFNAEYFPNYEPTSSNSNNVEFILDGRQRVTSIIKAFEEYSIVIDPQSLAFDDYRFIQNKKDLEPSEYLKNNLIPLKVLLMSDNDLSEWLDNGFIEKYQKVSGSSNFDDTLKVDEEKLELKNYLQSLSRAFLQIELNYDPIVFSSPKKAIDHFVIINTEGKTLTNSEIIIAKVEAETGILVKDRLKPYIDRLSIFGMKHSVILDVLIKCFSAQQGIKYTRYGDGLDFEKAFSQSNLDEFADKHFPNARSCFQEIGIPSTSPRMEYAQLFCLIAQTHKETILSKVKDKQLADKIIKKLFTALALDSFSHFRKVESTSIPTTLSNKIRDIFKEVKANGNYSEKLDLLLSGILVNIEGTKHKNLGTTLTLLKDDVVDILSGEKLRVESNKQIQYHHIVPRAYLKGCGLDSDEVNSPFNSIVTYEDSNKSIGKKAPTDYLENNPQNVERLNNLLIPSDFFEFNPKLSKSEKRTKFRKFLKTRGEMLNKLHEDKLTEILEVQL